METQARVKQMTISQALLILRRAARQGYVNSGYHNCVRLYAGDVTIVDDRENSEDNWANYCFCPLTLIAWVKLGVFYHQNQWKRAACAIGMLGTDAAKIVNAADYKPQADSAKRMRKILDKIFPRK